jgi:hypothetical protein
MSKKSIKDCDPNNVRCGIGLQRQRMKESFRRGLIQWLQDLVISLCINWNENENLHCSKIMHQIHNNHYKFPHAQVPKSSTNFTQLMQCLDISSKYTCIPLMISKLDPPPLGLVWVLILGFVHWVFPMQVGSCIVSHILM